MKKLLKLVNKKKYEKYNLNINNLEKMDIEEELKHQKKEIKN